MSTIRAVMDPASTPPKQLLADKPPVVAPARFPVDFRCEEAAGTSFGSVSLTFARESSERLSSVCNDKPARMLAVLAAAVEVVLFRYSWNEDVAVAACTLGSTEERSDSDPFWVIRNRVNSRMRLRQFVGEVQTSLLSALQDRVSSGGSSDTTGSSSARVAVTFLASDNPPLEIPEPIEMHFVFAMRDGLLEARSDYDRRRFRQETANGIARSLAATLMAILHAPDQTIGAISLFERLETTETPAVSSPFRASPFIGSLKNMQLALRRPWHGVPTTNRSPIRS